MSHNLQGRILSLLLEYYEFATRCLLLVFQATLLHSHMQSAHGVFNMTSLATLHMCCSLLWEDRKASASLYLSNALKQPKHEAQKEEEKTNTHTHTYMRMRAHTHSHISLYIFLNMNNNDLYMCTLISIIYFRKQLGTLNTH